jgi:thioesterase domain-containing protein
VFAIHAIEGTVNFYEELSKALGPEQPFYGFRSPLLFHPDQPETSLDELAARYVEELRLAFPHGPYFLLGASFGGHIAYEMARKLAAQGQTPERLLIIDADVPGSAEIVEISERVSSIRQNLRAEGLRYLTRKIGVKLAHLWEWIWLRIRNLMCRAFHAAGWRLPFWLRFFHVEMAQRRALLRHTFVPYSGKVTLVRAVLRYDILSRRDDAQLGWGPLAQGGLEIHHVADHHISMLDPPAVGPFAELIRSTLSC